MVDFVKSWNSGQVTRKHTMENIRAENIAEHTWGVVALLMIAWPKVPQHILTAAQFHDFGEKATGDMPGPTKWANPILEAEMERLEREHIIDTLPPHLCEIISDITEFEWAIVEIFDRADFCMGMIRERMLGNRYSEIYYKKGWDKMTRVIEINREDFMAQDEDLWFGITQLRRAIDVAWSGAKK